MAMVTGKGGIIGIIGHVDSRPVLQEFRNEILATWPADVEIQVEDFWIGDEIRARQLGKTETFLSMQPFPKNRAQRRKAERMARKR